MAQEEQAMDEHNKKLAECDEEEEQELLMMQYNVGKAQRELTR